MQSLPEPGVPEKVFDQRRCGNAQLCGRPPGIGGVFGEGIENTGQPQRIVRTRERTDRSVGGQGGEDSAGHGDLNPEFSQGVGAVSCLAALGAVGRRSVESRQKDPHRARRFVALLAPGTGTFEELQSAERGKSGVIQTQNVVSFHHAINIPRPGRKYNLSREKKQRKNTGGP